MTKAREKPRLVSGGDVVVIGAGIGGALIAKKLVDEGLEVTLVDKEGFGAAQSNHSHGYIHSGYIYRDASRSLIEPLVEASRRWRDLVQALGVEPLRSTSFVAFTSELNARAAASAWEQAGLPVRQVAHNAIPAGVREPEIEALFQTPEPTFDLTEIFEAMRRRMSGVKLLTAKAIRLDGSGQIEQAVVNVGPRSFALQARYYVLAAGTDNARLIEGVTRFRGRAAIRTSFMLVLRGPALADLSLVMPENEAHGLFVVSRPTAQGNVWLVSNFLSFAGMPDRADTQNMWLGGIIQKMTRFTNVTQSSDTEWGIYLAPKAELRRDPRRLGSYAIEGYDLPNAIVTAPTKLTLAPLLADEAAERIIDAIGAEPRSRIDRELQRTGSELPVRLEHWTRLPLVRRDRFFGARGRDGQRLLGMVRRPYRGEHPVA